MGAAKRPSTTEESRAQKKLRPTLDGKLDVDAAKAYFEDNGVKVHVPEGKDVDITPLGSFRLEGFAKRLIKYCESQFERPTPIQACCWPLIMQRSDICGIAKTGSGKTMAFALPFLSMSRKGLLEAYEQPVHTPRFVGLAPTRELAMQISTVCKQLTTALVGDETSAQAQYPVQCIYGGVPKREQRMSLEREGVDMLIATPGRLQDLVDEGSIDLSYIQYLVLDEADRMLDMGFIDAVKALITKMPAAGTRQTCMFSATWPASVHHLATQFLKQPVHVNIGSGEEGLVANKAIRQEVQVIWNEKDKPARLMTLLKKYYSPTKKIIIFGLYKKECAYLEKYLRDQGYDKTVALQGDMSQDARAKSLADFKATRKTPLIATDVAGRGLDVEDVELVINYTFPLTIEDYVHRIGRTGRAGKNGLAVCFFCPDSKGVQDERSHAGDLVRIMKGANQPVPDELEQIAGASSGNKASKKKAHPLFGMHFKTDEQMAALEAKKVHKTFDDSDDE